MKILLTSQSLSLFALYFITGVVMLAVFARLYILLTPYNEQADIAAGKAAPALALAGALLGFTLPLLSVSYHGISYMDYLLWGVIACVVQLLCFKMLYWLLPRHIEANNMAAAIVYAGAAVCVGLFNAFSLIP